MPQVSLLATLLATVLSFVLGGLWYGPLFGKTWMRLVGMTEVGMFLGPNPCWHLASVPVRRLASSGWLDRCGPTISSSLVPSRSR